MRERPPSRPPILDDQDRVLLFRFEPGQGPLAGQVFRATPGGGLDAGKSQEVAACREMLEETWLQLDDPGPQVARRMTTFQLLTGEFISADEHYFRGFWKRKTPELLGAPNPCSNVRSFAKGSSLTRVLPGVLSVDARIS
jgi:8-oxo-dGTP pyrophosphatase MutT (NUDIX family)